MKTSASDQELSTANYLRATRAEESLRRYMAENPKPGSASAIEQVLREFWDGVEATPAGLRARADLVRAGNVNDPEALANHLELAAREIERGRASRSSQLGNATEVLPRLWVGSVVDCAQAAILGSVKMLCVGEQVGLHATNCDFIQIVEGNPSRVISNGLEHALSWIGENWQDGKMNVLVHCQGGQERSPLLASCFIARYFHWNIYRAYGWVSYWRTIAQNRLDWLPPNWS